MDDQLKKDIFFDDELFEEDDADDDLFDEDGLEEIDSLNNEDGDDDLFDDSDLLDSDSDDDELFDDDKAVTVDSHGVVIGAEDLGLSDDEKESEQEDFEVVGEEANFMNQNGEIVVMDTGDTGDSFKLEYINIKNIAIVRRIRENKNVEDLVRSIKSTGLLMPLVVAPTATDGIYVLLHGYRRIIACAKAGIVSIPCIINRKVNTPEIPILEALYNHAKQYTVKEMVGYIDYLEKEKGILSSSMIEYLLQMMPGDYAKLKDILNDDDEEIAGKLLENQMTIEQAFRKLEQRRKKESKEEQELKKTDKVYGEDSEGSDSIMDAGEGPGDGVGLTDEEIKQLAISASELDDAVDGESLEEIIKEGESVEGFKPNKQNPEDRERLDPALRKSVLARDNNTCRCCGLNGQEFVEVLDAHHVNPVFLGGTDDIENLVTACTVCHKLIHLYSRGELYIRPISEMDELEQIRFKKIIKLGTVIRKGTALRGIKKDQLKKMDHASTIGRSLKGQVAG